MARRKKNVGVKAAACTVGGSAHKSRSASARKCGTKWSTSVQKFASTGGKAAAKSRKSPIGKRGKRKRRRNPETTSAPAKRVAPKAAAPAETNPRRRRRHSRKGRRRNPETALDRIFNPVARILNPSTVQTAVVTALGAVIGGAAMVWWERRTPAAETTQGYTAPVCPPGTVYVPGRPGRPFDAQCVPVTTTEQSLIY